MKIKIFKVKMSLDRINNRLDTAEEKINKPEDIAR